MRTMTINRWRNLGALLCLTLGAGSALAQPYKIDPRTLDPKLKAVIAEAVANAERERVAEARAEVAALAARVAALETQLADERRQSADARARLALLAAAQDSHKHSLNRMTAAGFQTIRIDGTWHRLMIAPPSSEFARRTGPPLSTK